MIKSIIESYEISKRNIEKEIIDLFENKDYVEYIDIVVVLFSNITYEDENYQEVFDVESITVIDNGDYQGTNIYIIPLDVYQPEVSQHFYTHNYYGSCTGCDLLQAASMDYSYGDKKTAIKDIMCLCLNLVQKTKIMEVTHESN